MTAKITTKNVYNVYFECVPALMTVKKCFAIFKNSDFILSNRPRSPQPFGVESIY